MSISNSLRSSVSLNPFLFFGRDFTVSRRTISSIMRSLTSSSCKSAFLLTEQAEFTVLHQGVNQSFGNRVAHSALSEDCVFLILPDSASSRAVDNKIQCLQVFPYFGNMRFRYADRRILPVSDFSISISSDMTVFLSISLRILILFSASLCFLRRSAAEPRSWDLNGEVRVESRKR